MRLPLSRMRLPWRLEAMAKGLGCWHCSEGAAWLGWPVARCSGCMACISGEPKAQHCSLAAAPDDNACYFEKPLPAPAPAETQSELSPVVQLDSQPWHGMVGHSIISSRDPALLYQLHMHHGHAV